MSVVDRVGGPRVASGQGRTPPATVEILSVMANGHRLRVYEALVAVGPATNARLGATVGLASGSVSFHLRKLASIGFVEQVPPPHGHADGRERWWRAVPGGVRTRDDEPDPDLRQAAAAADAVHADRQARRLVYWAREKNQSHWSADWLGASVNEDAVLRLTSLELAELAEGLRDVLRLWIGRAHDRADLENEQARQRREPVYVAIHGFPFIPG